MTNPNPEQQPRPSFSRRLRRTSLIVGIPLLVGVVGGGWWLWTFIHQQLPPLVEKNLTQLLNRPVRVGRLERISLTGLRFGASSLPVTPTDPDTASVEAVEVSFNPLTVLFARTLLLDVTLVNPNVYIQQEDEDEQWIDTTIATGGPPGPIQIVLDRIRLRNADITLVSNVEEIERPTPRNTIVLNQVNGEANLEDDYQLIQFNLDGQPKTGGTLALQGEYRPSTQQVDLQVRVHDFLASDLTRLIDLPLELQGGRVDSDLKVQLQADQPKLPLLYGSANLKGVTAQAEQLPQPFVNSRGTLSFQGTQVRLNNVASSYGKIPALANGTLDTQGDYNLSATVKAVSAPAAISTLKLNLPFPTTGTFRATAKVTGPIAKPVLSGAVANIKPVRVDRVNLSRVSTNFNLSTAASELNFKDVLAIPVAGGKITGNGSLQLAPKPGQKTGYKFNVLAQNIPTQAIAQAYGAANTNLKPISAQARIFGSLSDSLTDVNTLIKIAGGTVRGAAQLADQQWQASLQATGIQPRLIAQVPPTLQQPLNAKLNFSGSAESFQPEKLQATGLGQITDIAGGTITAQDIQIAAGRWQTQLQIDGIQLKQLAAQLPPNFQTGRLIGTLNVSGSTTAFAPDTISATGTGRLAGIAGGTVTAENIQLDNGQWQVAVNASQVQLNQFNQQLRGQLNGQLKLAGTIDALSPAGIRATGQAKFSRELIGQPLQAAFSWDGEKVIVQQVTSPNLQASGQIFADVDGPGAPQVTGLDLNVRVQDYNLQDIPVQLPNAANVAGRVNFAGQITGTLPVPNVTGSLRLEDLALNQLTFDPVLAGNVRLEPGSGLNLALTGSQNDRIALNLDQNYRPTSFIVQLDQAVATGRTQGDILVANVENFPITALNISPPTQLLGPGVVQGILSGDFRLNLTTFATVGDVAIAKPGVGRLQGDRLNAEFGYGNGVATLISSEFIKGESRYALSGTASLPATTGDLPQFQVQASIIQGRIQDILAALQLSEFQDFARGFQPPVYASANELNLASVGVPNTSLLTQLRRFSEIEVLLQRQRQQRRGNPAIPALASLTGTFSGEISASNTPQTGITAAFDLEGQNWSLAPYNFNQIIVQGNFEDDVLTLLPLRVESEQTLLAFTGQVGGPQQSGQLRVRNFPVDILKNFVQLPVDFSGNVDATATLAGSRKNPQAIGELQLVDGTLNQKPIESATASFSYSNARFNFGSDVVISGPEPIEITGSIPLALPFAEVKPDSDQIRLDVDVDDEGLALINLVTDQIAWQGGEGEVQLEIRGTLQQPLATGIATFNNATVSAQALPEPLKNITGTARFNFDRILVEGIKGNFNQGEVFAQGVIPIFANLGPEDRDINNPLTVTLDRLRLNVQKLYEGGINGKVVITGAALNPLIGGEILLSQGQVFIPETTETVSPTGGVIPEVSNIDDTKPATAAPKQLSPTGSNPNQEAPFEFRDLRIVLGEDVNIVRQPVIDILAQGSLTINGNLNDLRPAGTVRLLRGGVNLFTTQFLLDRDYQQTAIFKPNQGTDPYLNLLLLARVPEVTRTPVPSATSPSEITEPIAADLGALETVRVEARVEGLASQLFENLELTSTPSRSQSEIVALIGGGFIQTLGRADSAAGLANIAGTALLGNYQGTITNIGNTLGLSDLRIFPTTITDEESQRSSTLGLAAEASVDISRNFAVSAIGFLTSNQSAQFGVTYRLSDALRVRASSDFSDDSRAVVEYQSRF